MAGTATGKEISDLDILPQLLTTDMRMWGFEVCTGAATNILTRFRLQVSEKYGKGNKDASGGQSEYYNLGSLGIGQSNCNLF